MPLFRLEKKNRSRCQRMETTAAVVVTAILALLSRASVTGKAVAPCGGFSDSSVQTADCARNQTCDLTLSKDVIAPPCRVHFAKECRDMLVKAPKPGGNPTRSGLLSSFPARLSSLGVHYDHFYVQIALWAKDIKEGNVRGILMEFESDDEYNCLYQVPSCRFFNFANESQRVSLGSGEYLGYPSSLHRRAMKREQDKPRDGRQQNRNQVLLSHSCFGMSVEQGSFLLRLTSFPGRRQLVYHIKWPYHSVPTDIWSELVVGVASIPGDNEIHVIIQKPDKIPEHSQLHLQLWNASKHLINTETVPSDKPYATFRRVPKGRYSVMVSPQGYRCSFTRSCPSFWSDDVFVDEKLVDAWPVAAVVDGDRAKAGENMKRSDLSPAVVIIAALAGTLAVLVVAGGAWLFNRSRKSSKSMPSMLLVSLDSGRLEEIVIKHLAGSLQEFLGVAVRSAILDTRKYNTTALSPIIDDQEENQQRNEFKERHPNPVSRDALESYTAVAVVDFLHTYCQSEAGAGLDEEKSVARKTQDVLSMLPRRLRNTLCSVHMANTSNNSQSDLSSSNRSSHDPASLESDDTTTFLTVYPGRDCKTHKSSNASFGYLKNNSKFSDIPYFVLTTEALSFFQWGARLFQKSSRSFSHDFSLVFRSNHWQTVLTCLEKIFIDKCKYDHFPTTTQNDFGGCGDFHTIAEPSEFDCILALNNDNGRLPLTKISSSWSLSNRDTDRDCAESVLLQHDVFCPRDNSEMRDTGDYVFPPLTVTSITRLLSGKTSKLKNATVEKTIQQTFTDTTGIPSYRDTISSDEDAVSLPLTESLSTLERNKNDRIQKFVLMHKNNGDSFPGSVLNDDWPSRVSTTTDCTGLTSSPRTTTGSTDYTSSDNIRVVLPPLSLAQTKLLGNRLILQKEDLGDLSDVITDLVDNTQSSE